MNKNILKTLAMDLNLISEHSISEDYFYDDFSKSLFSKMKEAQEKGYRMYNLNSYESNKLIDAKYLLKDNIRGFLSELKDITLRYKTYDILKGALDRVKNKDVSLNDLLQISNMDLSNIQHINSDVSGAMNALEYIEEYKFETEEMEKSDKPRFYTFSHPILEKYVMMEKGWSFNIIGGTGSGKTIMACILGLDFVKKYKERLLFVTDENSKSNIMMYLKCSYFNLKFRDVIKRKEKLDEIIDKLNPAEKKEYKEIFELIDVWELTGIPIHQVKAKAKNETTPYGMILLDSFDEIDSMGGLEEVQRYELNGKIIEALAKDLGVILGVTAQLDTKLYGVSAEKLRQLCNHQAKSLVKKSFLSLVIGYIYNKDGDMINSVIKLNKCRSGGEGVMYGINKNYDYMRVEVEDKEYDLARIKEKTVNELDF